MKKTNKQIKKEAPTTTNTRPTKETAVKETAVCTCDSSCDCGCQEGGECTCSCNSSCISKTAIKCITMLVSAALISASILIIGSSCNKARPTVGANPVPDIKIAEFIKKNPQVIVASLENYQKMKDETKKVQDAQNQKQQEDQKAAGLSKVVQDVLADKTNYSLGNENGKYVIVEFFDYRCGWCKRTNKGLWEAIDGGKAKNIRWVLIDSPIFGEGSELISRYVLASGKQGKFKEMHHAVVSAEGNMDEAALLKIAEENKLNIEQLKADAASDEMKAKIANNQKIANSLGVQGVPYLIVNGKPNPGALLGDNLAKAIEESNK